MNSWENVFVYKQWIISMENAMKQWSLNIFDEFSLHFTHFSFQSLLLSSILLCINSLSLFPLSHDCKLVIQKQKNDGWVEIVQTIHLLLSDLWWSFYFQTSNIQDKIFKNNFTVNLWPQFDTLLHFILPSFPNSLNVNYISRKILHVKW